MSKWHIDYYEGRVGDTDEVLQLSGQETVTCYGSQRQTYTKASGCTAEEKECQVEHSVADKERTLQVHIVNDDTI